VELSVGGVWPLFGKLMQRVHVLYSFCNLTAVGSEQEGLWGSQAGVWAIGEGTAVKNHDWQAQQQAHSVEMRVGK
jgi:hypothetical protein